MQLDKQIARKQLDVAQTLLEEFKDYLPSDIFQAQQEMIDNYTDIGIIAENAKKGLQKKNAEAIIDGIRLGKELSNMWAVYNVLAATAVEENSQGFLYSALSSYEGRDDILLECYPTNHERFNILNDIPTFPKTSIMKQVIRDASYNNKLLPTEINSILKKQESLTPEDRAQISLVLPFAELIQPKQIARHPTLLQYQDGPQNLIKTAIKKNRIDQLEALETAGINFATKTVLPDVVAAGPNDRKPMMLWLIEKKSPFADAIMQAAQMDATKTVKFLLNNGADPNTSPQNLIAAIANKRHNIVDLLLEHGADCNAHSDDNSPIGAAITTFDEEIFSKIWARTQIDSREVLPGKSLFVAISRSNSTSLKRIVRTALVKHKAAATAPETHDIDLF